MLGQARTAFLTILKSRETELLINFTWNYNNLNFSEYKHLPILL